MTDIFGFLADVGQALWGMWTLDSSMVAWLNTRPHPGGIAIAVAMLAGISSLAGSSAVLFLNRVRGLRFLFALVLNGLAMVGLYALEALLIAALGGAFLGHQPPLELVFRWVMLSTAPHVFGVLVLAPYLGPGIARILQWWSTVVLWMIVGGLYQAEPWPALGVTLGAWGLMQIASWLFARPVSAIGNWIWRQLSGQELLLSGQDLLSGQLFQPMSQQLDDAEVR